MLVKDMRRAAAKNERSEETFKKRYQMLSNMMVGEGSYGTVYMGIDLVTLKTVALKVMKCSSIKHKMEMRDEVEMMRVLA